ncbi:site-2 protease family protein [Blastochloris viridis]|uniref:Zinc metalloprotease n=1 Tax=Blastochloris viridis TaxID=1079 RepID=A0A0H5B9R4_BLAVI|nr:site-2 protease family protein [Blastochloris viridis]ALK11072.1 Putative zinc metalloprotease Rip3 [Blastochloris viridis]BAR98940.1 putative zinc metalloprotease MJ0392 [Blastochloris viridis]CUU43734.1 Stage IV sporulation protein FB [Blastochloris viridis]
MSWSIPIGVIAGTVVRIHLTFLILLAWIGIAGYATGGASAALDAVLFISLLFACVVAHEFGHIFAARRYGIRTPDVTLLPIGGVASLERMPEKPGQELVVALAGPAVNVVIAGVLMLAMGAAIDLSYLNEIENAGASLIARLTAANLFLAAFNMIPAFPMDGGRVLRALLATRMGFARATALAAAVGQGVAFLLGFVGLFYNPLLIFIAIFVYLAATAESNDVALRDATRDMPVSAAMITKFETLLPNATVDTAVDELLRTSQKEFPVVDGAGRLRGVLTREAMLAALRQSGGATPVLEVLVEVPTAHSLEPLALALQRLRQSQAPALGVVDDAERLVGLVTPENVGEMMLVRAARPGGSLDHAA